MTITMQRDFFLADAPPELPPLSGLFADIVFDRPLDHAYTYGVAERLRDSIGVGKRVRAPFGRGDQSTVGFCVRLTETPPERTVKEVFEVLDDEPLLDEGLLRLTRWMADYYLCGWGQVLNAVVPSGARDRAGTRALTFLEVVPDFETPTPPPTLTSKQRVALEVVRAAAGCVEVRQLLRQGKCGSGPLAALLAKGLIRRVRRRVESSVDPTDPVDVPEVLPTALPLLNADQQAVLARIEPAIAKGGYQAFLLHGVTGSGKTEIYLRAIDQVIRQGKVAIVLVPEISLTPQTIAQFQGRFGEVAVLHSHLGTAERGSHWRRVASGQAQIVVGARSAVFAPTRNLGLIVIDEEHETSFKQETTPRYHARDVAVMRARLENVPILLGSATPSLESWHNAERGAYTLLTLPQRVLERPLPQVHLIDRRHEGPPRGRWLGLSDPLVHAMRAALKEGGQVLLLLNRRGFSTHIHCPACAYVASCQHCDLALTYHKGRDGMLCHYCGFEQEPLRICPICGHAAVRYQGLGTEKLQTEIEERFPDRVVRRMDSDVMKKPGSHGRVLGAFRRGAIDILLGTQMIAKGLDFPNVTLVGVVNADIGLHFPDFRAAEKTFQLLSQVAGRTGRGPRGGKVLIQTYAPDHPAIVLAARHDFAGFVASELPHRQQHGYPPYCRMARLIVRSKKESAAAAFAERLAEVMQAELQRRTTPAPTDMRLLGPAEAPVFKLKGYYRFHFQLQSSSAGKLHELLRAVLPTLRTPAGVEFTLDIDPFQML